MKTKTIKLKKWNEEKMKIQEVLKLLALLDYLEDESVRNSLKAVNAPPTIYRRWPKNFILNI